MSYSDDYKDDQRAKFLNEWAKDPLPKLTEDNLRHNIARANKAEAELEAVCRALRVLKGFSA